MPMLTHLSRPSRSRAHPRKSGKRIKRANITVMTRAEKKAMTTAFNRFMRSHGFEIRPGFFA